MPRLLACQHCANRCQHVGHAAPAGLPPHLPPPCLSCAAPAGAFVDNDACVRAGVIMTFGVDASRYFTFGRCWDYCSAQEAVSASVVRVFRPLCTHAFAVTKAGARKILAGCASPIRADTTVDFCIADLIMNGVLQAYAPREGGLFWQDRDQFGSKLGSVGMCVAACGCARGATLCCPLWGAPAFHCPPAPSCVLPTLTHAHMYDQPHACTEERLLTRAHPSRPLTGLVGLAGTGAAFGTSVVRVRRATLAAADCQHDQRNPNPNPKLLDPCCGQVRGVHGGDRRGGQGVVRNPSCMMLTRPAAHNVVVVAVVVVVVLACKPRNPRSVPRARPVFPPGTR